MCYNQPIYDDIRMEGDEYAGLTLMVRQSSVRTDVQPLFDHCAIRIMDDNDGKSSIAN